jgi:hypothetical protein
MPEGGAAFVAAMEEVLEVHEEEAASRSPAVKFDEQRVTLPADGRPPLPAEPGQPERIDDEDADEEEILLVKRFAAILSA